MISRDHTADGRPVIEIVVAHVTQSESDLKGATRGLESPEKYSKEPRADRREAPMHKGPTSAGRRELFSKCAGYLVSAHMQVTKL